MNVRAHVHGGGRRAGGQVCMQAGQAGVCVRAGNCVRAFSTPCAHTHVRTHAPTQAKRTADCVALSNLDLAVLTAFDFKAVVKDFPTSARVLKVRPGTHVVQQG